MKSLWNFSLVLEVYYYDVQLQSAEQPHRPGMWITLQERMLGKDGGFLASEMQKGIEILSIPITHAVKYFF